MNSTQCTASFNSNVTTKSMISFGVNIITAANSIDQIFMKKLIVIKI